VKSGQLTDLVKNVTKDATNVKHQCKATDQTVLHYQHNSEMLPLPNKITSIFYAATQKIDGPKA